MLSRKIRGDFSRKEEYGPVITPHCAGYSGSVRGSACHASKLSGRQGRPALSDCRLLRRLCDNNSYPSASLCAPPSRPSSCFCRRADAASICRQTRCVSTARSCFARPTDTIGAKRSRSFHALNPQVRAERNIRRTTSSNN